MAALDHPRSDDPVRPDELGNGADVMPEPPPPPPAREVQVPRLLVTGSELSWRFLVCAAALAVVVYALTKVSFAFVPSFVALMLATLLTPPARALIRRGAPPAVATAIVFVGGLLAFSLLIFVLAPPVVSEFGAVGERVRGGADKAAGYVADLPLGLEERQVQREIDRLDDRISENSGSITSGVLSGAQLAAQLAAGLLIMLVLLFFFVKDGPRMWTWALKLFPRGRRDMVDEMGRNSWDVLTHYVRGVVVVAAIDAIGIGIALWLIGVPLVVPLAALVFFAAFIPVIGAIVAGTVAALVALVSGGPVDALLVGVAILVIQQVEGNVLYPMIVSRTMELHPVVVLLSVTVGGVTAGIVGAAIAVPVAAMGIAAIKVLRRHTAGGEVTVQTAAPAPT